MTGAEFEPKWMSAPGATILDILEERGLSESDFAKMIGFPSTRTRDLLSGRTAITLEVAKLLQSTLGGLFAFGLTASSSIVTMSDVFSEVAILTPPKFGLLSCPSATWSNSGGLNHI